MSLTMQLYGQRWLLPKAGAGSWPVGSLDGQPMLARVNRAAPFSAARGLGGVVASGRILDRPTPLQCHGSCCETVQLGELHKVGCEHRLDFRNLTLL